MYESPSRPKKIKYPLVYNKEMENIQEKHHDQHDMSLLVWHKNGEWYTHHVLYFSRNLSILKNSCVTNTPVVDEHPFFKDVDIFLGSTKASLTARRWQKTTLCCHQYYSVLWSVHEVFHFLTKSPSLFLIKSPSQCHCSFLGNRAKGFILPLDNNNFPILASSLYTFIPPSVQQSQFLS